MHSRRRVLGYDCMKAFAMLMVILLHSPGYTLDFPRNTVVGDLVIALTRVCVPLFFLVNGALLLTEPLDWHKDVRRMARTVVFMEIWRVIYAVGFGIFGDSRFGVWDLTLFLLGNNVLGRNPVGHFWFLNALVAVYVMLPVTKYVFSAADRKVSDWFGILLVTFTMILPSAKLVLSMFSTWTGRDIQGLIDPLEGFGVFGGCANALAYAFVGGLVARGVAGLGKADRARRLGMKWRVCMSAGIILCWAATYGIAVYQARVPVSVDYNLMLPVAALAVLLFVLLLPLRLPSGAARAVTVLGSNTFGVYMLHIPVLCMVWLVAKHGIRLPVSTPSWAALVVDFLLVVAVFLLCAAITRLCARIPVLGRIFTFR